MIIKQLYFCLFYFLAIMILCSSSMEVKAKEVAITNVTSSSEASPQFTSKNAIDRNVYSFFSSAAHSRSNVKEWLRLDFGQTQHGMTRVSLYPRVDGLGFPQDFVLRYSEDGYSWFDIAGTHFKNVINQENSVFQIKFDKEVNAKYLQLFATKLGSDGTNHYLQLAEMSAHQDENNNHITPKIIEASSEAHTTLYAQNINNNNVNDFWSSKVHQTSDATEFLILTFKKRYKIDKLILTPRNNGLGFPTRFSFQYSSDGKNFKAIPKQNYEGYVLSDSAEQVFLFDAVDAIKIKISAQRLGPDNFNNYYFQLAEVAAVSESPFKTDSKTDFDKNWNELWMQFGSVNDGNNAVQKFGNEAAYFEWLALKIIWSNELAYKNELKEKIIQYPMSKSGYVWSWSTNPRWPSGNALHFVNNQKYILAAWRITMWDDFNFLDKIDSTTSLKNADLDNSEKLTVWEKIQLAMSYMETQLDGKDGLLTIVNDENTGTPTGKPSNYWDNYLSGHKDPYANVYFYPALLAVSEIWTLKGNLEKAAYYSTLAKLVRKNFNDVFWDKIKKRYISNIDENNKPLDFGFTFLNTEAMAYGLSDTSKAHDIYKWLDGHRLITSDNAKGKDIYYYKLAPRSNTLAIESTKPYWWNDVEGAIPVNTSGGWDQHLENGGIIFYTAFYDILARHKYLGINNAFSRMKLIADEYAVDELKRDPPNAYGVPWKLGIVKEFPESGLVPASFVYTIMGLQASLEGLLISPHLPDGLTQAELKDFYYQGKQFSLLALNNGIELSSTDNKPLELNITISNLEINTFYALTKHKTKSDSIVKDCVKTDALGQVKLTESFAKIEKLTLKIANCTYQQRLETK